MEWLSPTGHNDPSGMWQLEADAYDENEANYAMLITGLSQYETSAYLELTLGSAITCSKVRYIGYYDGIYTALASIDLFYAEDWHNVVTNDTPNHEVWKEVSFSEVSGVTKFRIRWYSTGTGVYGGRVYEVDFWGTVPPPQNITDTGAIASAEAFGTPTVTRAIMAQDTGSLTGFAYCHGLIYYNGYLYGSSRTNPGQVAKIDPATLDLSGSLLTPQHNSTDAIYLTAIIEFGGYLWTMDSAGWLYKINPSTLTVVGSWQVVANSNMSCCALCHDATYVYGTGCRGCFKFKLSDNSHSENAYLEADKNLHSIAEDGDYLYVSDTIDNKIRKINKSDLSQAAISTTCGVDCTDDIAQDGTYVYLGREGTSGGIWRVKKSDLTHSTFVPSPAIGLCYGVFKVSHGAIDRLLYLDSENSHLIVFSMPACEVIRNNDLGGLAGAGGINELAEYGNLIYLTQFSTAPTKTASYTKEDVFGFISICPSSISSAEAFGTPKLLLYLKPSAIPSAEAIGTAKLNQQIIASGIASLEAFGTAKLNLLLEPSSIVSAEAFGTPIIAGPIITSGIASAETFGALTVTSAQDILPSGITSAEAFGVAKLILYLKPTGIASAEAFGTAKLNLKLIASAITSLEAFGVPVIAGPIIAEGIVSAEVFGIPFILFDQLLMPSGIVSLEALGLPSVFFTPIVPVRLAYVLELHDSNGDLVTILSEAYGIDYVQALNAPHTLAFGIKGDDSKLTYLTLAREIWLRNYDTGAVERKFKLATREDVRL